jgi:hypothetical protein
LGTLAVALPEGPVAALAAVVAPAGALGAGGAIDTEVVPLEGA